MGWLLTSGKHGKGMQSLTALTLIRFLYAAF